MNNFEFAIFTIFALWSYFKINDLRDEVSTLKKQVKKFTKDANVGDCFVRLESVDEKRKIDLIKMIKEITDHNLRESKSLVDAVRLGSMSIIISNVSFEYANQIKEVLENCGAIVAIVEK
jgi:ribosomal protein L7/L12